MKKAIYTAIILINLIPSVYANDKITGNVYFIKSRSFAEIQINQAYTIFLERSIKKANNDKKAKAIILEVDTPGGRVDSALKIKDIIYSSAVPVYAYVNSHAISAGALIALAAKKIIMVNGGVIGDAAPVYPSKGKMVRAGEKATSALRAVFAALAERNNRPVKIAKAMVDSDIVLYKHIDGIDKPKNKLLTLSSKDALRLKIADNLADNLTQLLKKYNLHHCVIIKLDYSSTDQILSFFTNPIITSLLLTLGMLGMIFELKTPGWGVAGTIGILSLSFFFMTQILTNHAPWGAPVIFIIGVILLLVELFIIPGFGLVGIMGIILMILSFFLALGINNLTYAGGVISSSLVATIILSIILFKMVPKTRTFSKIVLNSTESTYKSPTDHGLDKNLINKEGIALTILRPSGTIMIESKRLDAVSSGDFIQKNSKIKVIAIDGTRLVVSKIT